MNKLNNLQTQISFKQNNKNIVIDLYQYYFNGGFHSIITEKITRLLISYFMIFLYNFLINCIDYNNILYLSSSTSQIPNSSNFSNSLNSSNSIHENKSIYDFIDMSAWISLNPYLLICFCIYCFYLIFLSLNMINIIKKNLKIREIYKKYLKINDYRNLNDTDTLENIHHYDNKGIYKLYNEPLLNKEIEDIERNVESINVSTNPLITESDLPSPITQFDSVLYNTLTENIRGDGVEIDCSMINNINEYISKAHYRINLVFWINLICIPFTVIILGLYLIIKYGEQIYRNPGILFQRQINITTKWKLRYYNELPNLYGERLSRIENNLDKIINTYNSSVRMVIIRFLTFLVGSIFLIVLVLSFIAPKEFSQLEIIPKHNVIWFLGVSGTLLLILNKLTNNSVSKSKLTKTEQITAFYALREDLITIHPQLQKIEDREYLVSLIHDIYKPRIVNMMYEILNLLLSPYYLWKWRKEVSQNASMILGLMENHYILGNVCSHSIFTNHNELINNPHMLISLKEFKLNHNWTIPSVLQINSNLTNSALLQTLIR